MPIAFSCPCGKMLRVPDEHAGRRAKCPACNAIVEVPGPEPVMEIVEEPVAPGPTASAPPAGKPAKPVDDDDYDGGTYSLAKPDRDDEKPREKKLPNFRKGRDNYS